jgi:NADH:ubiquinone oxidoreductase subunit 2 (subunit N)
MKEVIFLHLPEMLLVLGVIINTYSITIEKSTISLFKRLLIQNYLFIFILFGVILYTLNSLILVDNTIVFDTLNVIHAFKVNKTTQLLKIILCSAYLVMNILVSSLSIFDKEVKIDHILVLNFLILNSFFIIGSNNFIELLLCLEINTVAFLILATTKNYQLGSIESAFKYFLISAVSAAFYLLGVFILWSISGHIRFEDIRLFLLTDAFLAEFIICIRL